jgi:hypothetical protein
MLLRTAQTNKVAVVVTNQMQSNPHNGIFGDKPMLVRGQIMLYINTHIIHLRRLKLDNRLSELDISPCYPLRIVVKR